MDSKMPYDSSVEAKLSWAFLFISQSQANRFEGKAPSMSNRQAPSNSLRHRIAAHGGRFAMNTKRKSDGTFAREIPIWTDRKWDAGWISKGIGRFLVYRPDYPRCDREGYAFRSHVVYWLETGIVIPKDKELHHKNEIKIDDRFENLVLLTRSEHRHIHTTTEYVTVVCEYCGKNFRGLASKMRERGIKFCSVECFHQSRHLGHVTYICDYCSNSFIRKITTDKNLKRRNLKHRFCSQDCFNKFQTGAKKNKHHG